MTRCARSGSPHNKKDHTDKNNSLPTLSTPGPHFGSPRRLLVSFASNFSGLEAQKPFQNIHTEGSSPAPPNLLRQLRGSQSSPRTQSSCDASLAGDFIVSHVCPDLFDILGGMTFQTLHSRVFIGSLLLHRRLTNPQTLGRITPQCSRQLILLTVPQDLL